MRRNSISATHMTTVRKMEETNSLRTSHRRLFIATCCQLCFCFNFNHAMMQKIWEEHVALSAGHELIKMYFTSLGKRSPSSLQLELEGALHLVLLIFICVCRSWWGGLFLFWQLSNLLLLSLILIISSRFLEVLFYFQCT